jgi:hypothetical protein
MRYINQQDALKALGDCIKPGTKNQGTILPKPMRPHSYEVRLHKQKTRRTKGSDSTKPLLKKGTKHNFTALTQGRD